MISELLPARKRPFIGCTIVARNYIAQAEVLARSFKEHHPDCPFAILIIDSLGVREVREDGVELLTLNEIELDAGDACRMAMIYDVTELSTAVKPWLLRRFRAAEGPNCVMYFDPDIEIFAPLYDLADLARKHSIVLTPHVTEPIPQDNRRLSESDILGSGIYNLGFIAVGPGSEPFLDWWASRLRRESVIDPARMRFTDQRWIDFVPGLYPHFIVRDPGCNVAYWNLHSRDVVKKKGSYTVNGKPLRFFHFSGYNPDFPHILSKHQGSQPRVLLSEHDGVRRICKDYRQKLIAAGFDHSKRNPYGFESFASGLHVSRRLRRIYREALNLHEEEGAAEPPSPFAPEGEAKFLAWLNEPLETTAGVTRFMLAIHSERRDLQDAFPDPLGSSAQAYYVWFLREGAVQEQVYHALIPGAVPAQIVANQAPPPEETDALSDESLVNVAGYFRAELGVGEAARLVLAGLSAAEVPFQTVAYNETTSRQQHPFSERAARGKSDINIICVNADQTSSFAKKMGSEFFQDRYTIGLWFWEVEDFPASFWPAFQYVDEVWVATEFIRETLAKVSPKPVRKFHLPLVRAGGGGPALAERDLAQPFTFFFSFDFMSVLERKNPMGLITAFKNAFKPGEGPVLKIKSINGDKKVLDLERVRLAAVGRPDIQIIDGYLSAAERDAMMAECDCYVSLHRSEGYGLTMAEAMSLGKPVIATAYSGNMEFMTTENSYLCPFEYCQVGYGAAPYSPTTRWAQPNLDKAAALMRHVYDKREEAAMRGRRASEDIRTLHSPAVAGGAISDRIEEIRARRTRYGKGTTLDVLEQRIEMLEAEPRALLRSLAEERARAFQLEVAFKQTEERLALRDAEMSDRIRAQEESASSSARAFLETVAELRTSLATLAAEQTERAQAQMQQVEELSKQVQKQRQHAQEQAERAQSIGVDLVETRVALTKTLHASAAQLDATTAKLEQLTAQIEAVPYMSDPTVLRAETADGGEAIGYQLAASAGKSEDVYVSFEDIFRGSEGLIRDRQRIYLEILRDHPPVVDLGCGRGEMLDLLQEDGVRAVGVDLDDGMVARARAKGHEVVQDDLLKYLRAQRDHSVGGIFCAQVIEHLPYEALLEMLSLARSKLKPGGVMILETVNPHSYRALKTFWVDLTHNKPIFPEVLVALCRASGYEKAVVRFPCGTGKLEQDRLWEGEYAVIANTARASSAGGNHHGSASARDPVTHRAAD